MIDDKEDAPIPDLVKGVHPADVEADVKVEHDGETGSKDTSLVSVDYKTFEDLKLPEAILKAVYELKFQKPSKIQGETIPHILKGHHVIGQAKTGSGKTACFVIGMLNKINVSQQNTQALCLGPTRELVTQLCSVARDLGRFIEGLKISLLLPGGSSQNLMQDHMIFATPGIANGELQKRNMNLSSLRVIAIDEADVMVDSQGLGDHTRRLFRYIPKDAQRLLFSATFGPEVMSFVDKLVPLPRKIVTVQRSDLTLQGIRQFYVQCGSTREKFQVLDDIFGTLTIGQTLIFANRRDDCNLLTEDLKKKGHSVAVLHSDQEPQERDSAMEAFRLGRTKVLIATNALARGIDILQVTLIVNYDLPMIKGGYEPDLDVYLHRSGRTGRFGRKGITLNMIDSDRSFQTLKQIQKHWDVTIDKLDVSGLEKTLGDALKQL